MRTPTMPRPALAVAGLFFAGAAVIGVGAPAQAHPFGEPQTITLSSEGERVQVEWTVGGLDDLTLLGIELGVLPADRVMLDGAITFEDGDVEAVAESKEFRAYLLDRIEVESAGAECSGVVVEVGDLAEESADLEFTCAGPVGTAKVTARMLTDLHPAYRTLASGPDGQRAVFEDAADTHDFLLGGGAAVAGARDAASAAPSTDAPSDVGRSAAVQLSAVTGAVLLITVVGALVLRRRTRHGQLHRRSHVI